MAKEKEARRPFNLKKEVKLLPGYIILLLWVIFTIALLGWVFGASFSTTAEIFQGKALKFESGLHFENYAKAWNGAGVAGFFGNSLIYSVISCTILILVCAPAAYVLSRFDFKCNKFLLLFFMLGMMVPVHCILIPLFVRFAGLGLTNSRVGLMIPYITFSLPMTIFLLTGFFKSMPGELFEAAAIDGCGIYGCFFRIALPLCRTGFFVSGLMTFVGNWNELLLAMVFISDPVKKTLPVTLTYFVGPYATNYVQMFAAIIIAIAPTVIVYCLFSNQIVEGLTTGAVKG